MEALGGPATELVAVANATGDSDTDEQSDDLSGDCGDTQDEPEEPEPERSAPGRRRRLRPLEGWPTDTV